MQAIDIPFALQWYKTNVWDKVKGDYINSQRIADFLADMQSSMGYNAGLYMQQALNSLGANLVDDGIVGSQTLQAINNQIAKNEIKLYNRFYDKVAEHYYRVAQKPGKAGFLNGWINSLNKDYPRLEEPSSGLGLLVGGGVLAILGYKYLKG
jgi:lysozyme family protein